MCKFRLLAGSHWRAYAAIAVALLLLVGASGEVLAADTQVVVVQPSDPMSWRYEPATVSITAGSTVTWVNQGPVPITVTSPDGLFDSEMVPAGGSYTYTFDTPGTFRYFCVPYPYMKGVVVVTR
jgi:plastocyanin